MTTRGLANKVNKLIYSANSKRKEEAIYAALIRSDKYMKKPIHENLLAYFPYRSHYFSDTEKLEITLKNSLDSDVVERYILEMLILNTG